MVWIERQSSYNIPVNQSLIQTKALTLLHSLNAERDEENAEVKFKEGSYLSPHSKVQDEIACTGIEAAASYLGDLAKVINEGAYTKQQIFNEGKIALSWKKMPSWTSIGRKKSAWLQRTNWLLFGANAAGDFKPLLIYHSENPRVLKNYAKSTLPVPYKWNNKV